MKKLLFFLLLLPTLSFGQWVNQLAFRYAYKGTYNDSVLRVPVINSNRAFYSDKDSIGRLFFRPDSVKLFGHFPGNVIKALVTYDSIIGLKNQNLSTFIQNQKSTAQTGDYYVTGQGISASLNNYNAVTNTYTPFHSFATDALDTTKRLWSIGISGATGAPSNGGGNLVFRSYTNAGLFVANAMTVLRGGQLIVSSSISVPVVNFSGGVTGGGSSISTGASIANTLAHGGATYNNGTSTVTGDYTTSSTDTWINVNNTAANCTITINAPGSGLAAAGRIYYIKKISNNAFTVTIVVAGGATIDGSSSAVISSYNSSVLLHDDGTSWFIY